MVVATSLSAADPADRPRQTLRVVRADPRTGKLVRQEIVTGKPAVEIPEQPRLPEAHSAAINEAVERFAATQSLPPQLVRSVIKVESNYNPRAVSSKGARGLMQLMPATARRFGVADPFDPVDNIQGGTRYLKYLLDLYKGDSRLALAAYNAGEGAVEKYGTIPPYPETLNYLVLVGRQMRKTAATAPPPPVSAVPNAAEVPSGPARIEEVVGPDGSLRYISR
jgi:hypothetical protein